MKSKCFIFRLGFSNFRVTVSLFIAVLLFCFTNISGCASKEVMPAKNISDAEMAIKMAKENSAAVNAPLDIRIAEDKLKKSKEAAKKEDFILSQRLADEAFIDAKVAEVKSQTKKVKFMEKELKESIDTLQNEVNRNQQKY